MTAERLFLRLAAPLTAFLLVAAEAPARPLPWDIAWSPDGATLAVSDRSGNRLCLVPAAGGTGGTIPLAGSARGVVWQGGRVLVAEYDHGSIAEIDPARRSVTRRLGCGPKPVGLAVAGDTLLVAEYGLSQLRGIDLPSGRERFRLAVPRHPVAVAATPDGRLALTGGLLPPGAAGPGMAAELLLVDVPTGRVAATLPLPDGSSNVRGIAISRDGRLGAAVHTRGRTAMPTTQMDRGWINTNAITLVDLAARRLLATCLLDAPARGAADPWGVTFLPDGSLWVTLAGAGELLRLDLPRFERLLSGRETLPPEKQWPPAYWDRGTMPHARTAPQRWAAIAADPSLRAEFANNLALLSGVDLIRRGRLPDHGVRALAASPDGRSLAVAAAFDSAVLLADSATGNVRARLPVGSAPLPPLTAAEQGERLFFDGRVCFQSWMSCATCHHEARTDGLNWDLLNDGMGTPKNSKSMLHAAQTPPMTWTGVREDYQLSISKGFVFLMREPEPEQVEAVAAYLRSLTPEPSPYLERRADGSLGLSVAAERGRTVFTQAGCAGCHSGAEFTNRRSYDVGTGGPLDTPGLVELWRTAPYLHDGSAADVSDVLEAAAQSNRHGVVGSLTATERADLTAYLLSL